MVVQKQGNKHRCLLSYGGHHKKGGKGYRYIGRFHHIEHAEYVQNKVISKLPDYQGHLGPYSQGVVRYPKPVEYYDEQFETAVKEAVADAQRELGDDFTKTASVPLANLKDSTKPVAVKTSSVTGVSYDKNAKKWTVRFTYKSTRYLFGSIYDTEEQAIEALTIAKREFLNFKGTLSKAGLQKRCAEVKAIAIETVMGNIHDGQGWKCGNCGKDHPGKKKRCAVYAPGNSCVVIAGCLKWRGGQAPKKYKKRKKELLHVPVHNISASYPKKIKTVLEAGGLSTSDIEQKIHEVYHDDDLLNKDVFDNTLKVMVAQNQLIKDGDMYSLPGSSDTTTTNRNRPKAKKYERFEVDDDASFNSDMLVDESEDEGEEEQDSDDNLTEESYDIEDCIDLEAERAMKRKQAANDREDRAKRRRDGIPITPLPAPVKKKKKKAVRIVVEEEEVPDPPLSEYELKRLEKIQRNKERLASLGLGQGMKKLQ